MREGFALVTEDRKAEGIVAGLSVRENIALAVQTIRGMWKPVPRRELDAIVAKLWPLGDDTAFIPGHGPMSNFGHERRTNPFVGDQALARA